jgi:hypothetical protein
MASINVEEALEDLFSEYNSSKIEIELPSRGKGYTKTSKVVSIRTMDYEDEKFIASYTGNSLMDDLIKRCSSNIDLDELYLEDKLFLYYKVREASFGNKAKLESQCAKCSHINSLEVDLSKLSINYANDDFVDPKVVYLPGLKKEAEVRKIRNGDQDFVTNNETTLNNIWRFVLRIGEIEDPIVISKAVKRLSSADVRTLVNSVTETDFGIDSRVKYKCSACSFDNLASVGLSLDFFTMN